MRDIRTVKVELEDKREQMIQTGLLLGLSHIETITLSQEVDELHNEFMRIKPNKKQGNNTTMVSWNNCLCLYERLELVQ